jgi:hypothetical protein
MGRYAALLVALLAAGCGPAPKPPSAPEQPEPTTTDFARLPRILEGIRGARAVALYEGLPSEFWEPQLREQELSRKKTVRLHGFTFYDDRRALSGSDAEQFTALFLARESFRRFRRAKTCGGYHPDYCLEWATGASTTRGLVCLECGEVKFFGPAAALHCDLTPQSAQRIKNLLSPHQKERPVPEPKG